MTSSPEPASTGSATCGDDAIHRLSCPSPRSSCRTPPPPPAGTQRAPAASGTGKCL